MYLVFTVREAAIFNLKKLVQIYGTNWAQLSIMSEIISLTTNPKYLYRMTLLFCINVNLQIYSNLLPYF